MGVALAARVAAAAISGRSMAMAAVEMTGGPALAGSVEPAVRGAAVVGFHASRSALVWDVCPSAGGTEGFNTKATFSS